MTSNDDLRAELASFAASLRAYLEQQVDSGATGIPRGPRVARAGVLAAATNPGALPTVKATATPIAIPTFVEAQSSVSSSSSSRSLAQLAATVAACTRCALHASRTQTVFARGNPAADLCFVGEAPGADEDEQGLPFVGRAGQLLDRMIAAMGLSPQRDVYVCNIIKCRPPGNRRPEPLETQSCLPYLHEQLELVKPKVIVALGNTAVAALLETKLGITRLRGQWKLYRGTTLVMPTYHPSYLIRPSPQQNDAKRETWEDLQAVMRELKLPAAPGGGRSVAPRGEG
jgi:DNA polymerase